MAPLTPITPNSFPSSSRPPDYTQSAAQAQVPSSSPNYQLHTPPSSSPLANKSKSTAASTICPAYSTSSLSDLAEGSSASRKRAKIAHHYDAPNHTNAHSSPLASRLHENNEDENVPMLRYAEADSDEDDEEEMQTDLKRRSTNRNNMKSYFHTSALGRNERWGKQARQVDSRQEELELPSRVEEAPPSGLWRRQRKRLGVARGGSSGVGSVLDMSRMTRELCYLDTFRDYTSRLNTSKKLNSFQWHTANRHSFPYSSPPSYPITPTSLPHATGSPPSIPSLADREIIPHPSESPSTRSQSIMTPSLRVKQVRGG